MNHERAVKEWDLIIEPHSSIFHLSLRDLWRYRDLLFLLVRRDFVSFYKQTVLGPLWFFLQPLFTTLIYVIIFSRLARISTDDLPAPLFYIVGIVAWNYFAECLTKTSTVFKDNANMFGKVYFPRLIMPLSIVMSNLAKFAVQIILLVLVIGYYILFKNYHPDTNLYILFFPVAIIMMAALGLSLGLIISALTTKYRDLSFLVTFGVQLAMYATPVIYPYSAVPGRYKWLLEINPMTGIFEAMRYGLLGRGAFDVSLLSYSAVVTLILLIVGILVFNKVEKNFVDTV
ncbi:MAG: ABC transporter permease [Chitinophagaceae bacterium]|nr:ABC transporter permease [Chitinophagaceae bacterium]